MRLGSRTMQNFIKAALIAVVVLALVSGVVRAAFFPRSENTYESRPSYQLPAFTVEGFSAFSYQDEVESALSDQIPFAQYFKKLYNAVKISYQRAVSFPVAAQFPDQYFYYGSMGLYNGYLVYRPAELAGAKSSLDAVLSSFDRLALAVPDVEFCLYYVESDYDIDFSTGEHTGVYDYIRSVTALPLENVARFEISDFEDYSSYYYKMDLHWDYRGAYEGYRQLLSLLSSPDQPLTPVEEVEFPGGWRGSKANAIGYDNARERFAAYRFDYPAMTIRIDGAEVSDYGAQEAFFSGSGGVVTYLNFYGENCGEAVIDTHRPERENILLIADSFSHALLKPLAAHYNRTALLDPRITDLTVESVAAYIAEHEIDRVLFLESYGCLTDRRFEIGG